MSSSHPGGENNTAPTAKPFSISLSSSSSKPSNRKPTSFNLQQQQHQHQQTPNTPNRTRPHTLHHDSDSEAEEDATAPSHEAVTGFDTHTGTVISADQKPEKKDLVIPVTSKNNWRDRPGTNLTTKGKKNLLPPEVQALQRARERGEDAISGDGNVETDRPSVRHGLSFAVKDHDGEKKDEGGDKEMKDAEPIIPPVIEERKPLTQDEIAMQALIRESKGETEAQSDLVIPALKPEDEEGEEGVEERGRFDETSSFRADVEARPESATLDQYNAIPVEEFGAALLRGMGWKEGQPVGRGNYSTSATDNRATAPRVPERRPGFLGIGAKDLSGGKGAESEIGAWGKAAMRKSSRKNGSKEGEGNTEGVYMPVLMRNKETGEYITEEELAAAQKEAKRRGDDDDWRERRDRNLERSGRDRDREYRRRDYENGDDYDRRRTGSSRRDRSLSSGDRHSRRRRYDDEDGSSGRDDRSYRERDRDRDRERRRDRERDRSHRYRDDDRYSSRHSSSNTSRHRDRDRERDRDSDRDSYRRRRHDDR